MQTNKLDQMIEILKKDLGEALITANIWDIGNGKTLATYNGQPRTVSVLNRVTNFVVNALKDSDLPDLEGYYTLNLANRKYALVLPLNSYRLGLLVDMEKIEVGLLLNVTLPKIMDTYEETTGK